MIADREYEFMITPVDPNLGTEPWRWVVDPEEQYCRILQDEGEIVDEIHFEAIPSRLVLPEFAGSTRWPTFIIDEEMVEFKVDRDCLKFMKVLTATCMSFKGERYLSKKVWSKYSILGLGVFLILAVTPVCIWFFAGVKEEFSADWFGFTCAAFCIGLMLVVNSIRELLILRKALAFSRTLWPQRENQTRSF